jgi:DNA-binding NarL/FixJ family response regulator
VLDAKAQTMRRVLLIARRTLFGRGVENLLRQAPGLEVWVCAADEGEALARIEALQPDVVVLEHQEPATDAGHALKHILRANEQLKVIELDPQDDTIWIYSTQQQVFRQVADLVAAIEDTASV